LFYIKNISITLPTVSERQNVCKPFVLNDFSAGVRFLNGCDYTLNYKIMFKKLFGSKELKEEKILPWIPLNSSEQLAAIDNKSKTKTQVIFKHSTRCGISRMVMNQFVNAYDLDDTNIDLYYLDLLSYRDVSNEVGYKFQVMHQSPQLLVIKNGVTVAHASHGGINEINLDQVI